MIHSSHPQVSTTAGIVEGRLRPSGVATFLGIPYAQPPVGVLRWRAPGPARPWAGIYDASGFGADCPQRTALPVGSRASGQSEDCLNLNIWAPAGAAPGDRLPVMVWIFGGSFQFGSASEERADGDTFARDGIIHVTINYRVGMFGFLAHPELVAESPHGTSGNYGLLDQIEALRWVRANIEAFGGDPDGVTLFGVSAGAASIGLLMTAPLAQGLFTRVILQSPGTFRPLASLDDAQAAGARLGSLESLRAMTADELLDRQKSLEPAVRSLTAPRILRPIRDGVVIPADERDSVEAGRFAHVPVIVGTVTDEGSNAVGSWPVRTIDEYRALLDANFGDRADDAARIYPISGEHEVRDRLGELFGDTQFSWGVASLAGALADAGVPVYRYVFTRQRPAKAPPRHSECVSYVFDRPDLPPRGEDDHRFDERDVALAHAMHACWVAFAKTGEPGRGDWLPYTGSNPAMMEFADEPRLGVGWRVEQMRFLDTVFATSGCD